MYMLPLKLSLVNDDAITYSWCVMVNIAQCRKRNFDETADLAREWLHVSKNNTIDCSFIYIYCFSL